MTAVNPQPEPVVLIHGTFAYDENEVAQAGAEGRWWQRNSAFCQAMAGPLGKGVRCAPAGQTFVSVPPWWKRVWWWLRSFRRGRNAAGQASAGSPEGVFHWSGDNSERARREAGKLLLEHLRQFDRLGRPFHVIAHSHGASVLWEALCVAAPDYTPPAKRLAGRWWKFKTAVRHFFSVSPDEPPLPNLASWTTVGHPFFHFGPDIRRFWAAVPLAVIGLVIWLQGPWVRDFWNQMAPVDQPWYWKAIATLLGYATVLLATALPLRVLWSFYCWQVAREDPTLHAYVRDREGHDVVTTLLACLLAAGGLAAGFAPRAIRDALDWSMVWQWRPFFASLWVVAAAVIFLYLLFFQVLTPVYRWAGQRSRERRRLAAWRHFGEKHLCLAIPDLDEAINGLRALKKGLRGTLLPRFPSPRQSDFSEPGGWHLRRPEREYARQSFWTGLVFRYLLLPVALVRDWVLYPLYNEVFASLIDEFVLDQLQKRAHGSDIPGLRLVDVTEHPLRPGEVEKVTARATYPPRARREIVAATEKGAAAVVEALRSQLFEFESPVALNAGDFFERAMKGDKSAMNLLVHTAYFASASVQRWLAWFIKAHRTGVMPRPRGPKEPAVRSPRRRAVTLGGLVAFVLRLAVLSAVLSAPAALLYGLGWAALFSYSRQCHLEWASDSELALLAEDEDLQGVAGHTTPFIVRWWVSKHALEENQSWLLALRTQGWNGLGRKLWGRPEQLADFGKRIGNDQARLHFFCKVAEKYAEIDDCHRALDALVLARTEAASLGEPSGASNHYLRALALVAASFDETPGELDQRVLDKLKQGNEKTDAVTSSAPDAGVTYIRNRWEDLQNYWKARRLAQSHGAEAALKFIREYSSAEAVRERQGRRDSADERVRSLAVFLARERPTLIDPVNWDQLLSEFASRVDRLVCEAECEDKGAAGRGNQSRRLMDCLERVLAVWLAAGHRDDLLWKADEIQALLQDWGSGRYPLDAEFAYVRSLRAARDSHEVTTLLKQAVGNLENENSRRLATKEREYQARKVAGALARWGEFRVAKGIADQYGAKVRLETAIEVMANELEGRAGDQSPRTTASYE